MKASYRWSAITAMTRGTGRNRRNLTTAKCVSASKGLTRRFPVPDAKALEEGLKIAREAYQADYARAETALARRELAKKMLQKAAESKAPPPTATPPLTMHNASLR